MVNIRKTRIFDLYSIGQYEEAIKLAENYLEENPNDIYVLDLASLCYRKINKIDEAIKKLNYILLKDCINVPAKMDLFDIYFRLERYEEAKPLLDELLSIDCDAIKENMSYYSFAKDTIETYLIRKEEEFTKA